MGALQNSATALVGMLLLGLTAVCRSRSLPRPPLRLCLWALACWALLPLLPLGLLPTASRTWVEISDDLLLSFAVIRLALWLVLEIPGHLRWWPASPELLIQMLSLGGWGLATVLVVRQSAKFDLVNLVATSAVLTAVIGLAAQEGLKDLFSGLELQLAEDFSIGDWLELGDGRRGTVVSLSWRETRIRTLEDCLLVVPNSKITSDYLINRSFFGACCDRFDVGLDYDFPPAQALPLLERVLRQHPLVLSNPPPLVRLKAFHDCSISYELQIWQTTAGDRALLQLRSQLQQQIWYALRRQGQSIPFPVQEMRPRRSAAPHDPHLPASQESCLRVLASLPIFADLNQDQLQLLVLDSQLLTFGPGESVVREGAEGDSLYCLLRGEVEVLKTMEAQRSVRVSTLSAGDVFGEMTLFLDAPRSATVRTLEECLLMRLGRPAVRRLLEDNPALLERFATMVSARQAELDLISRDRQGETPGGLLETMKRLFAVVGRP